MRDSEDLRNLGGRREQMYCSRGTATQMDKLTEMAAAYHNAMFQVKKTFALAVELAVENRPGAMPQLASSLAGCPGTPRFPSFQGVRRSAGVSAH